MAGRRKDIANLDRQEIFEHYRPLLFSIACSILGDRAEAEELLQETLDGWLDGPHSELGTARKFLVTHIAVISLERLQVTHRLKEQMQSCPFSAAGGPPAGCSMPVSPSAASVSKLGLMALDGLTPAERSAFLLRQMFKRRYSEIARIFDTDESACRKIVSRAKRSLARDRSTLDLLKRS